jgi:hypothetical protein
MASRASTKAMPMAREDRLNMGDSSGASAKTASYTRWPSPSHVSRRSASAHAAQARGPCRRSCGKGAPERVGAGRGRWGWALPRDRAFPARPPALWMSILGYFGEPLRWFLRCLQPGHPTEAASEWAPAPGADWKAPLSNGREEWGAGVEGRGEERRGR